MKQTFRLNDQDIRYDQVMLWHGHEIGLYGYFLKGAWTVLAHIDGNTLGYYESVTKAINAARETIEAYDE